MASPIPITVIRVDGKYVKRNANEIELDESNNNIALRLKEPREWIVLKSSFGPGETPELVNVVKSNSIVVPMCCFGLPKEKLEDNGTSASIAGQLLCAVLSIGTQIGYALETEVDQMYVFYIESSYQNTGTAVVGFAFRVAD